MIATVTKNENVFGPYYHLEVGGTGICKGAMPGSFFMLKVGAGTDPLLRRPISLHSRVSDNVARFLYKSVGKGTSLLSSFRPGDAIDALGPLGNGFRIRKGLKQALIVAGGIGVAPLLGLGEYIKAEHPDVKTTAFIGIRGEDDLLSVREFHALGFRTYLCTEDGSMARCGFVTDSLEEYIQKYAKYGTDGWEVFSCGPKPMMKAVAALCGEHGLNNQASLESHMACGIGACLGCVTPIMEAGAPVNRLVCKDGPVFDAHTVVW